MFLKLWTITLNFTLLMLPLSCCYFSLAVSKWVSFLLETKKIVYTTRWKPIILPIQKQMVILLSYKSAVHYKTYTSNEFGKYVTRGSGLPLRIFIYLTHAPFAIIIVHKYSVLNELVKNYTSVFLCKICVNCSIIVLSLYKI